MVYPWRRSAGWTSARGPFARWEDGGPAAGSGLRVAEAVAAHATNEVKPRVTRARLLLVALVTVLLGITAACSDQPVANRPPPTHPDPDAQGRTDAARRRRPRSPPGVQPAPAGRPLAGDDGARHPRAALPVQGGLRRHAAARPDDRLERPRRRHAAVHGELRGQPRGVLVGQRPGGRRGLRLPLAADAGPARRVRRGGLPADHRRALARGRQGRRRRVLPALPGLAAALLRPAARAPAQGRPRLVDRGHGRRAAHVGRPVQGVLRGPRPRRDRAHPQRRLLGHPDRARPARAAQARPVEPRGGPGHRRRRRGAAGGRRGRAHRAGGRDAAAAAAAGPAVERHPAGVARRHRPAARRARAPGPRAS